MTAESSFQSFNLTSPHLTAEGFRGISIPLATNQPTKDTMATKEKTTDAITHYFTYTNDNDGLVAIVATGNDCHDYRVIMNDNDAEETVQVLFTHSIEEAHKAAREFTYCESIA